MKRRAIVLGLVLVVATVLLVLFQFGYLGIPMLGGTFGDGRTYVSLRFDDGWKSQLNAARLLGEYDIPGSIYIISGFMGREGYMTWDDVQAVSQVMEIGGHTVSHSDLRYLASRQAYEAEIGEDYRALTERGFTVTTFVYPYGNYSPAAINVVKKYYDCASTQNVGTNTDRADPYLLKDYTIRGNNSLQDVTRMVVPGAWTILTFHDVGEAAPGADSAERGNAISEAFFEEILQWLSANDIEVIAVTEGCHMLRTVRSKAAGVRM